MRTNRLMWFAAGAVTMAVYLQGPYRIADTAYGLGYSASEWVRAR